MVTWGNLKCSAEVNSASAEVLPAAKRSYGAKAPPQPAGPRSCPVSMPYGEDKKKHQPIGWCFFFVSKWIVRVLTGQALRLASLFSRLLPGVLVDDPLNELNRSINAIGGRVDT